MYDVQWLIVLWIVGLGHELHILTEVCGSTQPSTLGDMVHNYQLCCK